MKRYSLVLAMLMLIGLVMAEVTYSDSLLKAAKSGDPVAQNSLGICYEKGLGVEQNTAKAIKYFRLAAYQDLADAQFNMARHSYSKKKFMLKWYNLAVAQGHTGAMVGLGQVYHDGNGVTMDYNKAAGLFKRAADAGDVLGMYWYGLCYYWGDGVLKNYAEAAKLFQRAAEMNNLPAMNTLASCYLNGKGVEKNPETAYYWYLISNALGFSSSKQGMYEVEQILTTEQANNAQKQAQAWLDAHNK